jgi:prepilin-type N-terminal cleavage/methylation domain-containing protein
MIKKNKGFTLIELLVVIAIIGILSSVVIASMNSARRKSRDARRISDISNIKTALEMYYDSEQSYPAGLAVLDDAAAVYIPKLPQDPTLAVDYTYVPTGNGTDPYACDAGLTPADPCTTYLLGAILEDPTNPALDGDADGTATGFDGTGDATCAAAPAVAGVGEVCYDTQP